MSDIYIFFVFIRPTRFYFLVKFGLASLAGYAAAQSEVSVPSVGSHVPRSTRFFKFRSFVYRIGLILTKT